MKQSVSERRPHTLTLSPNCWSQIVVIAHHLGAHANEVIELAMDALWDKLFPDPPTATLDTAGVPAVVYPQRNE
jgi:hypothetical protein